MIRPKWYSIKYMDEVENMIKRIWAENGHNLIVLGASKLMGNYRVLEVRVLTTLALLKIEGPTEVISKFKIELEKGIEHASKVDKGDKKDFEDEVSGSDSRS
jgi:hypothetical protein